MAEITGNIDKILTEETDFESPASEQVMQKIGANINALIDAKDDQTFNSSGNYTVPENITTVMLLGAGAGGGGGGGQNTFQGGAGGRGIVPRAYIISGLTPLDVIPVTIGGGGSGGGVGSSGNNGGNTTFGSHATFSGGNGGPSSINGSFVTQFNNAEVNGRAQETSGGNTGGTGSGADGGDSIESSGGNTGSGSNSGGGGGAGVGNGGSGGNGGAGQLKVVALS